MATPTYVPLATYTVTGSADPSITFSSIPATYRDLILVMSGTLSGTFGDILFRLNGFTTGYSSVYASGGSGGVSSGTFGTDSMRFNFFGGWNNTNPGSCIVHFMDYSATDKHKTALGRIGSSLGGLFRGADMGASRLDSTAAVTSIEVFSTQSLAVGTTISIYGVN